MHSKSVTTITSVLLVASLSTTAHGGEDWTGFYAGLGIGGSHMATERDNGAYHHYVEWRNIIPDPEAPSPLKPLGAFGADTVIGAHGVVGHAWQFDRLIVGVEAGLDILTKLENGAISSCKGDPCGITGTSSTLQRLGHIRALVGTPASEDLMLFLSGGVSLAKVTASTYAGVELSGEVDEDSYTSQRMVAGATFGVGADLRVTDGFRLRLEGVVDAFAPAPHSASIVTSVEDGWEGMEAGAENRFDLIGNSTSARLSALWDF